MTIKYKLNVTRDVDSDEPGSYILNLPWGFCFDDEIVHVRGFDTMKELRDAVKYDVMVCDCSECQKHI